MIMIAGEKNYGLQLGMKVRYHFDPKRPDKVMEGIMDALYQGATFLEYRAKQLAPKRSGLLRGSIEMKELTDPDKGYSISPDTDYDIYVEFGTGKRGEGYAVMGEEWKTEIMGMRAQPYIGPR